MSFPSAPENSHLEVRVRDMTPSPDRNGISEAYGTRPPGNHREGRAVFALSKCLAFAMPSAASGGRAVAPESFPTQRPARPREDN